MSQLSRPYQIALLAVLLLSVVWFVALRPGEDPVEPPLPVPAAAAPAPAAAPGVAGLDRAADAARAATASANGTAPAPTAAAPVPAPAPNAAATTAPRPRADATDAEPALAATDDSDDVIAALRNEKVAVVLFADPRADVDREVARAVAKVRSRAGRVRRFTAPIAEVGRYEAITRDVRILTAPTVLVIGPDLTARTITGFTDPDEIDDAVGRVLRRARAARDAATGAAVPAPVSAGA